MTPSLLRLAGDERLARLVTNGHDAAFSALYDRYRDVLVRYCRSLVRDDQDALDAFQSTMLNALRALREDRRRAPVRPWLFRIAHNESVSVLRRRSSDESLDLVVAAGGDDVHRRAEDREALAGLIADLGSLTEHQRGALLLRELGGLDYDEVASVLETTPLAARQAVFAARASLHDQREGRELPCAMVQRRLSDGDRRAARTRAVRAHLRGCDDCRGFAAGIGRRRRAALLLPVPPAFASSGLLASILEGGGSGTTAVAGGGVAAGVVAKAAVALSAAVVATGAAERPARRTHHAVAEASAAVARGAPAARSAMRRVATARTATTSASAPAAAIAERTTRATAKPTRTASADHTTTRPAAHDDTPSSTDSYTYPAAQDPQPRSHGGWDEDVPVRAPRYGGAARSRHWARPDTTPAQPAAVAAEQPAAEPTTTTTSTTTTTAAAPEPEPTASSTTPSDTASEPSSSAPADTATTATPATTETNP